MKFQKGHTINQGRKHAPRQIEDIRRRLLGHRVSKETRKKIGDANRGKTGALNGKWKGGKIPHSGYILVICKNHPFTRKSGYVLQHRLVIESKIGRFLRKGEEVHHMDGDRSNNDPKNLMCFSSKRAHRLFEEGHMISSIEIIYDGRIQ